MTGILSKIKLIPGISARSDNTDNVTDSFQVFKHLRISHQSWLWGVLFVLLLLTTLILLRTDTQYTRNHSAYREIIGRTHTHIQHLVITSREALRGNELAFVQLRNNLDQLNHYSTLLQYGGQYQHETLSPLTELLPTDLFRTFQNTWRMKENQVRLILESREALVKLAEITKQIDSTSHILQKKLQELSADLTQANHAPNQIIVVETVKILTQFITGSVSTLLQGGFQAPRVTDQPAEEPERITDMIETFMKGKDWLYSAVPSDQPSSEALLQIQIQFNAMEDLLRLAQRLVPEVTGAWHAMQETFSTSETLSTLIEQVEHTLAEHHSTSHTRVTVLFYTAAVLTAITCLIFILTFSGSLSRQIHNREKGIENTQKAILRLLNEMEKPASGNLTARMSVTEDITGAIADSINLTIEELQELVKKVNHASSHVIDASLQAEQVSSNLLIAAQEQARKIEEATVAVLGIAESLEEVSGSAEECADVARQTLHAAESGANAVHDAIAGMNEIRTYIQETAKRIKRLGESSQEIGEIVTLISDITEQTNVLALNAAIQAASAGEAGKGFSVIAQEIQRLAEHSAEATKQISTLVRNIRGDTQDTIIAMERSTAGVVEGARRANATGDALEEIEEVSKRLAQLVTRISDATRAQTIASNRVTKSMEDILSITRQTTQGTSQNAGSVKQIAGYATELKSSVSNFKV